MSDKSVDIKPDDRDEAPLEDVVEKVASPVRKFKDSQVSSGIILLIATVIALLIANSPWQQMYHGLSELPLSLSLGDWTLSHSLKEWVNDGLLVVFFFLLGMEIKRELMVGDLKDISQSSLVLIIALGGMVAPALIYVSISGVINPEVMRGWGIPMATDTAFALGLLALLGNKVPGVAAVILSALAIVDDIGAVLVINLFYSDALAIQPLLYGLLVVSLMVLLNVSGIRRPLPYFVLGIALWYFVLHSGVHATTAGIIAALFIPSKPAVKSRWFTSQMHKLLNRFERMDKKEQSIYEKPKQHQLVEKAQESARLSMTPLQHWTSRLEPSVYFFIIPVFALLNAGVTMPDASLGNLLSGPNAAVWMGILLGLFIGKPIGIGLFAWLGIKLKLARLPKDLSMMQLVGVGWLAGIGFTMSLFIATLAFEQSDLLLKQAKIGVLTGSLFSAIGGSILLLIANARTKQSN
jgi:NhaA family Na+:H+ antiporter